MQQPAPLTPPIPAEPDAAELRVVGCLIEKERSTPDQYPLSLNSLRLACNQSTNRDPVVDYDEAEVRRALGLLGRRGWIRSASGHGSRTLKYRHLLGEALRLDDRELSLLAVLMLRGAQTPGELKQRTERLHSFDSLAGVRETLEQLIERDLVERLERRPGQKEERYRQLVGGASAPPAAESEPAAAQVAPAPNGDGAPAAPAAPSAGLSERVDALQRELSSLRSELEALRSRLDRG